VSRSTERTRPINLLTEPNLMYWLICALSVHWLNWGGMDMEAPATRTGATGGVAGSTSGHGPGSCSLTGYRFRKTTSLSRSRLRTGSRPFTKIPKHGERKDPGEIFSQYHSLTTYSWTGKCIQLVKTMKYYSSRLNVKARRKVYFCLTYIKGWFWVNRITNFCRLSLHS